MVKFNFLPCDVFPHLNATCSIYEFDATIIYPLSYGNKKTAIQKDIESHVGFKENFPVINIDPLQLYLMDGNIVRSISLYFGEIEEEEFSYEGDFEKYPLATLAILDIDTQQDNLYFKEQVSVKIDREKRVICVGFGERKEIYQTFSLADDLIVHADKDNNLVAMVFRNFQWIDIETKPSIPWQYMDKKRSLFFTLTKYLRKLF